MDAYMQSLPIDAQCLIMGLMVMVGMLVLVGVINIIQFIFPSAGTGWLSSEELRDGNWHYDDDDLDFLGMVDDD